MLPEMFSSSTMVMPTMSVMFPEPVTVRIGSEYALPGFVIIVPDFYRNDELVAMTRELTDTLRRNRTIDWEKRDDARAKMRMMIKKLLKHYDYPPEGMEDALQTVMAQCEMWTDNEIGAVEYPDMMMREETLKVAEQTIITD